MERGKKRLFFGLEVFSPWPESFPEGRMIAPEERHLTLAFLGSVDYATAEGALQAIPKPPFRVGRVGYFGACLFLPQCRPSSVSWSVEWLEGEEELLGYRVELRDHLVKAALLKGEEPFGGFLPHVTLCRRPFSAPLWEKAFSPLPMGISALHLYESLGSLHYRPLFSHRFHPPFVEIDHTADIAYAVYGEDFRQLFAHAFAALAFAHPALLSYFILPEGLSDIEGVVVALNGIVAAMDCREGSPIKAVSFHGRVERIEGGMVKWEMIVDV